jgi:hypothetical protein|tara:strand:+ start:1379 stop:1600 length:222 start_codon:yes stop_codon:yes gene_type:complete
MATNTLKVQGFDDLVRDIDTKAIINTNRSEYNSYMKRVKSRESGNDMVRGLVTEINNLKKELYDIKKDLKKGK